MLHYNMLRELHVNMRVMWCDTWLAHPCMFVDVVSTCNDRMTYVVDSRCWCRCSWRDLVVKSSWGNFGEFWF